jgi:GTP pyrophosphokinase/guanosine-3',5'-bis(diphosphate) 3'-pyrophosphohydrolase
LRNGDHVEIITADWSQPNPAWLTYVVTSKARANIRSILKNQKSDESARLGERLLEKALEDFGANFSDVPDDARRRLLKTLKVKTWNELLSDIGLGNRLAGVVARQLVPTVSNAPAEEQSRFFGLFKRKPARDKGPMLAIRGTEGVVVTYARCCRPIPGDPILGFLTAGRGIVVHTEDCPNVVKYRKHPEQWIDVQWERDISSVFPVNIRVESKNQRGVLAAVAATIAEQEANIDTVSFDDRDGRYTSMNFTLEVRGRGHLAQIMRRIRALEAVVRINRKKG